MLIILSGRAASGKSTLAKALAANLGVSAASFGNFVRSKAALQGLDVDDRLTLQNLGQTLVDESPDGFVRDFLAFSQYRTDTYLIVDGLRHLKVLQALQGAITPPDRMALVFVDIQDSERHSRLQARGQNDEQIAAIERHQSERDVLNGLRDQSTVKVEGDKSVEALVRDLKAQLGVSFQS